MQIFLTQRLMITNSQDLLLKSGLKSVTNHKKITSLTKKSELKRQCLDKIYAILVMRILL